MGCGSDVQIVPSHRGSGDDCKRGSSGRSRTSATKRQPTASGRYATRVDGRFQIMTIKADGSDPRQVTSAGSNEDPSWSPDGRYLVFSSKRGGAAKLFLSDLSGANQAELTTGGGGDTSPSWSGWLE